MPGDKFRCQIMGPARQTQEEAEDDMNRLFEVLEERAPELIAHFTDNPAPRPLNGKKIPAMAACNEKSTG